VAAFPPQKSAPLTIERATNADYAAILELNETAVPHVNSISMATLGELVSQAFYFRVAREQEKIAGFLIALSQTTSYESPNFLWFRARYDSFVYVDRIVVSSAYRRSGIGRDLYCDLEQAASVAAPSLTCEVNLDPSSLPARSGLRHSAGQRIHRLDRFVLQRNRHPRRKEQPGHHEQRRKPGLLHFRDRQKFPALERAPAGRDRGRLSSARRRQASLWLPQPRLRFE
jgi:predicted GNAT superfamily acetyltransferase